MPSYAKYVKVKTLAVRGSEGERRSAATIASQWEAQDPTLLQRWNQETKSSTPPPPPGSTASKNSSDRSHSSDRNHSVFPNDFSGSPPVKSWADLFSAETIAAAVHGIRSAMQPSRASIVGQDVEVDVKQKRDALRFIVDLDDDVFSQLLDFDEAEIVEFADVVGQNLAAAIVDRILGA